jgi:hypothetical protein
MEETVARAWLASGVVLMLACSQANPGQAPDQDLDGYGTGRELIPAEWTIAEDTSGTGEVTTASVQLPTARDIGGLLDEEAPRLVLRCLDGRVRAFIDTEGDRDEAELAADSASVEVQLDSAPACE